MIITLKELADIRAKHDGQTIVYIGGTFDLLHLGHVRSFEAAKQHGDILVVSVDSDEATWHYKGRERPIISEDQRVAMVDAIRAVDYAVINPLGDVSARPYNEVNVMELLRPDVFVTSHIDGWEQYFAEAKEKAPKMIGFEQDLANVHTSDIIAKIRVLG